MRGKPRAVLFDHFGGRLGYEGLVGEPVLRLADLVLEARRFLAGERKLQGVLVGLVMKKSSNSADHKQVNQLLSARIGT